MCVNAGHWLLPRAQDVTTRHSFRCYCTACPTATITARAEWWVGFSPAPNPKEFKDQLRWENRKDWSTFSGLVLDSSASSGFGRRGPTRKSPEQPGLSWQLTSLWAEGWSGDLLVSIPTWPVIPHLCQVPGTRLDGTLPASISSQAQHVVYLAKFSTIPIGLDLRLNTGLVWSNKRLQREEVCVTCVTIVPWRRC